MRRVLILPLLLALAAPLAADEPPRLTVTGEGRVEVAPDMARVTLGILAREATAEGALAAAAGRARAVLDRLGAAGVAAEDVQTAAIRLDPVMVYAEGPRRGSRATRRARRSRCGCDASRASARSLILRLPGRGRDRRHRLRSCRPTAARGSRAGRCGGRRAPPRRGDRGGGGLALGPVLEIAEGGGAAGADYPVLRFAEAAAMPVAPGQIAIGATVRIVFALGPP